jgi:hypothetical protein
VPETPTGTTTTYEDPNAGWRMFAGAAVVVLGIAALVISLALVLDAYESETKTTTKTPKVSSNAQKAAKAKKGLASNKVVAGKGKGKGAKSAGGSRVVRGGGSKTVVTKETPQVTASSVVAILTPLIAGIVGIAGLFFGLSASNSARGREADAKHAAVAQSEKGSEAAVVRAELGKETAEVNKQVAEVAKEGAEAVKVGAEAATASAEAATASAEAATVSAETAKQAAIIAKQAVEKP